MYKNKHILTYLQYFLRAGNGKIIIWMNLRLLEVQSVKARTVRWQRTGATDAGAGEAVR
ncbi:MAG: hypothetical protein AVDCRST_MAG56-474 [uncultured Cytophagales bacterium]|uniref:Uncharacterized protein n=1 Tax=uncultured Cytophagales bacterium TaxID=158755 RepID=A0A6J4HHI1_9SPHI|nr:MAG: hypothetical protein AVDCRST_MAG56-474 [uncultured Cytophagales bacterium]